MAPAAARRSSGEREATHVRTACFVLGVDIACNRMPSTGSVKATAMRHAITRLRVVAVKVHVLGGHRKMPDGGALVIRWSLGTLIRRSADCQRSISHVARTANVARVRFCQFVSCRARRRNEPAALQ